jgi:hypothetical protein
MGTWMQSVDAEGFGVSYALEPDTRTNRWLELPVQGGRPMARGSGEPIAPVQNSSGVPEEVILLVE